MQKKNIIFLADDDPDIHIILQKAHQKARIPCILAYFKDGQELMNHLYRLTHIPVQHKIPLPDLVLTDLKMPQKDGLEVLKEMKSCSNLQNIPVAILTNFDDKIQKQQCYNLGAKLFLGKANSMSDYVDIASLLDRLITEIKWASLAPTPPTRPFTTWASAIGTEEDKVF